MAAGLTPRQAQWMLNCKIAQTDKRSSLPYLRRPSESLRRATKVQIPLHEFRAFQCRRKLRQPMQYVVLIQGGTLAYEHTFNVTPILLAFGDGLLNDQILGGANCEAHT